MERKGESELKRDPIKKLKEKYTKRFQIIEFFPLLFWKKCEKCRNEFKREGMWQTIIWLDSFNRYMYRYRYMYGYGCKECFHTKEEFREFLIENGYVEKKYLLDYDR